jgi:hypothetical protein
MVLRVYASRRELLEISRRSKYIKQKKGFFQILERSFVRFWFKSGLYLVRSGWDIFFRLFRVFGSGQIGYRILTGAGFLNILKNSTFLKHISTYGKLMFPHLN